MTAAQEHQYRVLRAAGWEYSETLEDGTLVLRHARSQTVESAGDFIHLILGPDGSLAYPDTPGVAPKIPSA